MFDARQNRIPAAINQDGREIAVELTGSTFRVVVRQGEQATTLIEGVTFQEAEGLARWLAEEAGAAR